VHPFIKELEREVLEHEAVNHSFLRRVSSTPFSRAAWAAFATQLYPHVHFFIPYMEELLRNTHDCGAKATTATILLDEYGADADGDSHPDLMLRFVRAAGGQAAVDGLFSAPIDPATIDMVDTHMRLCGREPFAVGLGAIGTAHELAITRMFPPLVEGVRIAGFAERDVEFFTLHVAHDHEHAQMLGEAVVKLADTDEKKELVRRGTRASLEKRVALWSAMERRMIAVDENRQPPPGGGTLAELARRHPHVPDRFWQF
jgi:pyrroloquinoline-quinone synthase